MRIALIADAFPPLRTSGAVQLRDLSREFQNQGHEVTVILPSPDISTQWLEGWMGGVRIIRLRSPRIKDVHYIRRTIAEFLMPFFMKKGFNMSPYSREKWDAVVWYSPSIFHGPFIRAIKTASRCKSYLIIRDIFPQWAVDMGLIRRVSLSHLFFKAVERFQYSVADIIGVQTGGNLKYFQGWSKKKGRSLEILQNWLFDSPVRNCSIAVSETKLAGRKIFVYAGNMGVAQGVGIFLDLADRLQHRLDIGFLFVGRGSEFDKLKEAIKFRGLENTMLFDEIEPEEISGLYIQCAAGLIALDHKHNSHNIPGKFLTYLQAGLPVVANINAGNDLNDLIQDNNIGRVCVDNDLATLEALTLDLIIQIKTDVDITRRCRTLYLSLFSPIIAVKQIIAAVSSRI
jgi:glycosyltransferase involved in cell wall biosynthesis